MKYGYARVSTDGQSLDAQVRRGPYRSEEGARRFLYNLGAEAAPWHGERRSPIEGLRTKSWDEFAQAGEPEMDFVFTVCDQAAGEACPVWPGKSMTAHWGVPDPAAVEGSETLRRQAFRDAFRMLENRIRIFTSLQPEKLDRLSLKRRLDEIGRLGANQAAGSPSPS